MRRYRGFSFYGKLKGQSFLRAELRAGATSVHEKPDTIPRTHRFVPLSGNWSTDTSAFDVALHAQMRMHHQGECSRGYSKLSGTARMWTVGGCGAGVSGSGHFGIA
jgi:hypothetical protein